MKMSSWNFRDVSIGIKKIREFLLGRKFVFHQRFPPLIAPRSLPRPDIPRGPEYKYSAQWYGNRDALNSVKPPQVAPIAEGVKTGSKSLNDFMSAGQINFPSGLPTPGCVWWFDAHCYYKEVVQKPCSPRPPDDPCVKLPPKSICETPPPSGVVLLRQDPCAKKDDPCAGKAPPRTDPCKVEEPPKPPPPEEPCDPCKPPKC